MTDTPSDTRPAASARPRTRRVLRWALPGLVALGLLAGALAWRDATAARGALLEVRDAVADATAALGEGDRERAEADIARARAAVADAEGRVDGPVWAVGRNVPVLGRSARIGGRLVSLADAAVGLAETAVARADVLLPETGLDVEVVDGHVDLAPLDDAADALGALDTEPVTAARARLAATTPSWVPAALRSARADALTLADRTLATLERGRTAVDLLPRLLGGEQPRTFLLAAQTSAELRGTGGLIGLLSLLHVEQGQFTLSSPRVHEALGEGEDGDGGGAPLVVQNLGSGDGEEDGSADAAVPVSDAFAERYGHVGANALLSNVNVDPDVPTTAPLLVDLYEQRTGRRVDGVILLDAVGLERLLTAIGPVPVPERARVDDAIPAEIPAERVAEWATVEVYDVLGRDRSADRNDFFLGFGLSAFRQVFSGTWDGVAVTRQIGRAAAGRHLQVYSTDTGEQAALERLGLAGRLAPARPDSDLLAVTANNAVGGKQDVHVGHRFSGEVRLGPPGRGADGEPRVRRDATLRTTLVNPLPATGRDVYIIGNCLLHATENRCFEGPPGWNRTWFTVWVDDATRLRRARDADGALHPATTAIHGHHAYDHFLDTPPESEAWFETELSGTAPLVRDGPDLVYRLTWWRQAKAVPDHLDLTLVAPDGWGVAQADVEGGGEPTGMGALGDGRPVGVEVDGRRVHLEGAVTRDTVVEVRLSRSLAGRVWSWLTAPV